MNALPVHADYLELLGRRVPMIDVRAPGEFAAGALPFAANLPLLDDDERRKVGICYKEYGQDAAIALGHKLVAGDRKQARIDAWRAFSQQHPHSVLYCARGGLRSQISQRWLAEAGVTIPRVDGGFKHLRGFLLSYLDKTCRDQQMVLLSGMTGTGKTDIIKSLDNSVDLEGIANHKGSSFGQPLDRQPSQIDFENHVILDLLRLREPSAPAAIVLEDEGRNIGGRHLPPPLVQVMKAAPMAVVEVSFEERLERLWQEYVVDRYAATVAFDPTHAEQRFADYLRDSVFRIRKRLGGERTKEITALIEHAIAVQHSDDFASHRNWLEVITANYYDPMYRYQLEKRKERIVFRGARSEIEAWLRDTHAA